MLDFDLFQVQLSWELSFFSAKAVRIALQVSLQKGQHHLET